MCACVRYLGYHKVEKHVNWQLKLTMRGNSVLLGLLCFYVSLPYHLSLTTINGSCADNATKKPLKLLTILPHRDIRSSSLPSRSWDEGMVDLLSSRLAQLVEQINEDPDLLPCHKLELINKRGGCDDRFQESLASGLFPQERSKVVGILGTGCSVSAIEAVKLASRPEIQLVIVHNGGSLMLENYKNSIGILGSSRSLIDLSLALIKNNDWHNVDVLYESGNQYYHEMKSDFLDKLTQYGVTAAVVSPLNSFFYPFNEIRSSRVRIVFVLATLEHTKRILCLAYHMGFVYPAYQWVILGHRLSNFVSNVSSETSFIFSYDRHTYTCSNSNLIHAFEKTLLVRFLFHTNIQTSTYFNLKYYYEDFSRLWDNDAVQTNLAYSFYDALYAWVSVLHNLTINYPDIEFNYANISMVEMITEKFFKLSFEGITGQISFNLSTGFANRPANLYQVYSGREMIIGSLNGTTINILQSFSHISDQVRKIALPYKGVTGFFIAAQLIELFVVVILHILTTMYRNTKSVKATSPKLIHLMFVGGYIFIATLMLWCISWAVDFGPETDASICQIIWAWGLPLSFTLTLGIVTMRTWRLYRIFVHYLDPGKFLSNPALTLAVLLLASVDVAIAIVWTVVDPMKFRYNEIMVEVDSHYEIFLEPECFHNLVWLVLELLFRTALLVALIVLTVLTRKIPNATFTTNSLKIFTYAFSVVSVIGFGIYFLLMFTLQYPDPHAEFITLSSLLNVQLVLFITFITAPPLVPVLLKKIKE